MLMLSRVHLLVTCSPPVSSILGILQARILEWVAIFFSWGSCQPRDRTCISCTGSWVLYHCTTWEAQVFKGTCIRRFKIILFVKAKALHTISMYLLLLLLLLLSRFSRVPLCATPWTAAYQAPPSMRFSGQQYWSGVPLPSMVEWKKLLSC